MAEPGKCAKLMPGMLDPLADPDLVQAIAAFVDAYGATLHVSAPALVQSFDATRQAVTVVPLIQHEYPLEGGDRAIAPLPIVAAVPVAFGAVEHPLVPGDVVTLIHTTRSIAVWWRSQGSNEPVDPQVDRHHDLSDAIAIPCVRRAADAIADFTTAATVVRAKGTANEVRIGNPSASSDASRIVIQSALADFMTALSNAIPSDTTGALAALQTALQALNSSAGWLANTTQSKAA